MPPPGDPTWYAGSWKSNPLTVVVGDVPYVPESEATRLRAEVEALREGIRRHLAVYDSTHPVSGAWLEKERFDVLRALLAARKGEG